jgi:hypothetical protein
MLQKVIDQFVYDMEARGIDSDEAEKRATRTARQRVKRFMAKNVALHDPDRVASESPTGSKKWA